MATGNRKADFNYWQQFYDLEVWKLVALSFGIDPRSVEYEPQLGKVGVFGEETRFFELLEVAIANLDIPNGLPVTKKDYYYPDGARVSLVDFANWASTPPRNWALPDEMLALADRVAGSETAPSPPSDELAPRSRALLLKIIRVLAVKAEVPEKKAGETVQAWAAELDVNLKADTVARILKEAQQKFG